MRTNEATIRQHTAHTTPNVISAAERHRRQSLAGCSTARRFTQHHRCVAALIRAWRCRGVARTQASAWGLIFTAATHLGRDARKVGTAIGASQFSRTPPLGGANLSNPDHLSSHPLHGHEGAWRTAGRGASQPHQKKEGDEAIFRATLEQRLRQAARTTEPVRWGVDLLPESTLDRLPRPARPIRVWTQDESRFGLITILRRRLTLRGVKPRAPYQHERQSFSLYGSVEPLTGESFFLELPGLNAPLFQVFLDHFAKDAAAAATLNLLVLDQAPAHIAGELRRPSNVRFIFTPPYTPEVSPIERLWEDLHAKLAGCNPLTLNALSDLVCEQIQAYTPARLSSLTSYPFFKNAANALCSM